MPIAEPLESRRLFAATLLAPGYSLTTLPAGVPLATSMAFTPDGRILVAEQGGSLRVVKNDHLLPTPAYTVRVNSEGERGLGGVAVDPNFASNGYVYLYYTATSPTVHNRLARVTLSGDTVIANSEVTLLDLPPLKAKVHNGGSPLFGPDGKLYVGIGDNQNRTQVQKLTSPFGKILRLNPDGSAPSDNPFATGGTAAPGSQDYVYALGVRNPFTFAFQPGSGLMLINDVGEASWEEINLGAAGANYGWPNSEGPTTRPGETAPFYTYPHPPGSDLGSSVTGGAFLDDGRYYFGDFAQNVVRTLDLGTRQATDFITGIDGPVDLDVGPDGSLYILSPFSTIYRVTRTDSDLPSVIRQPRSQTTAPGQTVTLEAEASGPASAGPLSYQWQHNGVDIPGATASAYTFTAAAEDNNATYQVTVTNAAGSTESSAATLTVDTNLPPVPVILSPKADLKYTAGSRVTLKFDATDPEQKKLPNSAFAYKVTFHHRDHTHPFIGTVTGKRAAVFTPAVDNELDTEVFYRVELTVTDAKGLSTTVIRDVAPKIATVNLASNLTNLPIGLDSVPTTAPTTFAAVAGVTRTLSYPAEFEQDGVLYRLAKSPKGKFANGLLTFPAPAKDTTLTLTYKPA